MKKQKTEKKESKSACSNILLYVLIILLAVSIFFNGWLYSNKDKNILTPENIGGCVDEFTDHNNALKCRSKCEVCWNSQYGTFCEDPSICIRSIQTVFNACADSFNDKDNVERCKDVCSRDWGRRTVVSRDEAIICASEVAKNINADPCRTSFSDGNNANLCSTICGTPGTSQCMQKVTQLINACAGFEDINNRDRCAITCRDASSITECAQKMPELLSGCASLGGDERSLCMESCCDASSAEGCAKNAVNAINRCRYVNKNPTAYNGCVSYCINNECDW